MSKLSHQLQLPHYIGGAFRMPEDGAPTGAAAPTLADLAGVGPALAKLEGEPGTRDEILVALVSLVGAERGFLLARADGDDEAGGAWQVSCARDLDGEPVLNPLDKIVLPLVTRCLERQEGFQTADLSTEPVHEQLQRDRLPRTRSLLLAPLADGETVLYLDHRFQSLDLGDADYFQVVWLVSLLSSVESGQRLRAQNATVSEELRDARRALRNRKSATTTRQDLTVPATPAVADQRGLRGDFSDIVGRSPEILEILQLLEKISDTGATVLINGESGTGKELVARSIHKNSERAAEPFVSENCAALAETLLETELFGHVKGAYTGASEDRPGLFEIASGGTLFLDEIGDTSPGLQKRLLRVLQEGVIRRVGDGDLIKVDVRIISATNKDLAAEVDRGRFREDLYYRLNVINVPLPPLRERLEDLEPLTDHFLAELNRDSGQLKTYGPEFMEALQAHDWPGNIRELQNQIRRVYALGGERLEPAHLSHQVTRTATPAGDACFSLEKVLEGGSLKDATDSLEKQIIQASLDRFAGNKAKVCTMLGIPKTTLYAKLKRLGLHDA